MPNASSRGFDGLTIVGGRARRAGARRTPGGRGTADDAGSALRGAIESAGGATTTSGVVRVGASGGEGDSSDGDGASGAIGMIGDGAIESEVGERLGVHVSSEGSRNAWPCAAVTTLTCDAPAKSAATSWREAM